VIAVSLADDERFACRSGGDEAGARSHRLLFDATGVVHWHAFFSHPSGRQRVTEELISSSTLRHDAGSHRSAHWRAAQTFARAIGLKMAPAGGSTGSNDVCPMSGCDLREGGTPLGL